MRLRLPVRRAPHPTAHLSAVEEGPSLEGTCAIGSVEWRQRVRIAGRVRSMRIQPWSGVATLECTVVDDTGGIGVVFLGRRSIAGIGPGTQLVVEGTASEHHGRLTILNPDYELFPVAEH